ncbi:unnamed protein product [Lota lota]
MKGLHRLTSECDPKPFKASSTGSSVSRQHNNTQNERPSGRTGAKAFAECCCPSSQFRSVLRPQNTAITSHRWTAAPPRLVPLNQNSPELFSGPGQRSPGTRDKSIERD